MNAAASISTANITTTEDAADSDSDASSDGLPDYYQPISSSDNDDDDDDSNSRLNGYHHPVDQPPNSSLSNYPNVGAVQNGVTSLDLSTDEVEDDDDDDDDDAMRRLAESDAAMRRAFLEDDLRRNAPLPSQTSARVMEAMRAVSFSAVAPHWSLTLPDDRWIPQLHRLRRPPSSS